MQLVPKKGHGTPVFGVPVATINSKQKSIYFLGPRLNSEGDELRAAMKALDEFEKARQEKKEEVDRQKESELHVNVIVASVKQQYAIELSKDEIAKGVQLTEESWKEALGEYYTEDDLNVIVSSMRVGKTFTRESLFDYLRESQKAAAQEKKAS